MKFFTCPPLFFFLLLAAASVIGQDLNVTSILAGSAADGSTYNLKSDGAPYVRVKQGKNVVESQIQGIGDWELNTLGSTTRKVYADFSDPVVPGDTSAPFSSSLLPVRFLTRCAVQGVNLQLLAPGASVDCGISFGFYVGSAQYGVRMYPVNYAGTSNVGWTCTGMNITTGRCNAWTAEPNTVQGDGETKAIGQLIKLTTRRGNIEEQLLGKFYFKFRVNLTAP